MPLRRYATLLSARNDVLARIGQPVDGATDPGLKSQVDSALASAQQQLIQTCDWMASRRLLAADIAAGQAWVDLPEDCRGEYILEAHWFYDSEVSYHLDPGDYTAWGLTDTGQPQIFDLPTTVGVVGLAVTTGGTGYSAATAVIDDSPLGSAQGATATLTVAGGAVTGGSPTNAGQAYDADNPPTIAVSGDGSGAVVAPVLEELVALRLAPIPEEAGTVRVHYLAAPAVMSADTDRLSLDTEAVVGRAAAVIASRLRLPGAESLMAEHRDYLANHRPKQAKPEEPATLSVPRETGVHVRSRVSPARGRYRW